MKSEDEYFEIITDAHVEFNKEHGFSRFEVPMELGGKPRIFYLEEEMVQYLLEEDVLFVNSRKYLGLDDKTVCPETLVLFVLINDTFGYSCADAESVTMKELPELCKGYCDHGYLGVIVWVAKKRKCAPIKPWIKSLKVKDLWDEELEGIYQEEIKMMKKVGKGDSKVIGPVVDLGKKKSEEVKKDKKKSK